jgi:hypothetical protein
MMRVGEQHHRAPDYVHTNPYRIFIIEHEIRLVRCSRNRDGGVVMLRFQNRNMLTRTVLKFRILSTRHVRVLDLQQKQ